MSLQKHMGNIDSKMWVITIKQSQFMFIDWRGLETQELYPIKPSKSKKLRIFLEF